MTEHATILDRYIAFADRAVGHPEMIEELRTIFAPDATVQLFEDKIHGIEAIIAFYRGFIGSVIEGQHFWTTTTVDDDVLEARWVGALRFAGDRLVATGGVERARLNADGLIQDLLNTPEKPGA